MGTLAAGIKDIFSTAKTTGTNVMLSGNDGTPDGHITMANLASVLGALGANSLVSFKYGSFDCNNILTSNGCVINFNHSGADNAPSGATGLIALITTAGANGVRLTQILVNGANVWTRGYANSWTEWTKVSVPTFLASYTDLSSLASAIGIAYKDFNGAVVDLNSLGESKKIVYSCIRGAASGSTGLPDESTNGNFVSFGTSAGFIEFFQTAANIIYLRMKWGGGNFTTWRQL